MNDTTSKIIGFLSLVAILATYVLLKINHVDTADFLTLMGTIGALGAAGAGTAAWKDARAARHQTNGGGPIDSRLAAIEQKLGIETDKE